MVWLLAILMMASSPDRSPSLDAFAQAHAAKMAASDSTFHSGGPYAEVVGRGPSVESVWKGFQESPSHRRVISMDWDLYGIGVVHKGEFVYVVVVYDNRPAPYVKPDANLTERDSSPVRSLGPGEGLEFLLARNFV